MDKCTRPISMKDGKYILCGNESKYTVGGWDVCEDCKPIADYYTKKYALKEEFDKKNVFEHISNERLAELIVKSAKAEEYKQNLFDKGVAEFLLRVSHFMDRVEEDIHDIDKRLNKLEGETDEKTDS